MAAIDRGDMTTAFRILSTCLLLVFMIGTAPMARAAEPLHARFFERAFSPDFVADLDDSLPGEKPRPVKIFFRVAEPGKLKISSGRVIVADPFVALDSQALSEPVPNGEHQVRLAVLNGSIGRGRIAFARVDFSAEPVTAWSPAVPEDMKRDAENPLGTWGVPVDSGTAGFFDPEAAQTALAIAKSNEDFFDAWLEKGQNQGARERGAVGAFRLAADSGPANVVAFDSGWGDGVYTPYFGFSADGKVAALLIDFDIIDWSKVKE